MLWWLRRLVCQLPALISLHDEIKDKKRKLRKKGEYDAWLSAKKEEKEEQDKTSQSRALAIGHWLPRFKQYGRLDTRRAERAKYQQIIKRKEEKEAAQAVLAANRLPAYVYLLHLMQLVRLSDPLNLVVCLRISRVQH